MTPRELFGLARLVFWDFDGVIKDSLLVKEAAFSALFEPYGSDLAARVRQHHRDNGGVSRFEKFPLYLSWAGQANTPEAISDLCARMENLVRDGVMAAAWVPGVQALLRNNPFDQSFVVVSATPLAELTDIIHRLGLDSCFRRIYGAPIRKADAIAEFMTASGIPTERCLMIGDARADFEAAEKNSIPFLLRRHDGNAEVFRHHAGPSVFDFNNL